MKTYLTQPRMVWTLFLAVCFLVPAIALFAEPQTATLVGVIESVEFDDDGNPTAVAVADDQMGWVLISSQGKGAELLNHVGATVKMVGTLEESTDEEFDYVITVSKYSVEKAAEDDSDMDEDSDEDEGDDD